MQRIVLSSSRIYHVIALVPAGWEDGPDIKRFRGADNEVRQLKTLLPQAQADERIGFAQDFREPLSISSDINRPVAGLIGCTLWQAVQCTPTKWRLPSLGGASSPAMWPSTLCPVTGQRNRTTLTIQVDYLLAAEGGSI